jgi:hypothetical protein
MALENIKCPQIQAVSKSGWYLLNFVMSSAIAAGGRRVNDCSSGDLIISGRINAEIKVMKLDTTRAMLPIRPISPRASFDSLASRGASYLKYVSPTQVVL